MALTPVPEAAAPKPAPVPRSRSGAVTAGFAAAAAALGASLPATAQELGDLTITARQRILSARGLDTIVTERALAEKRMASADPEKLERAMASIGSGLTQTTRSPVASCMRRASA